MKIQIQQVDWKTRMLSFNLLHFVPVQKSISYWSQLCCHKILSLQKTQKIIWWFLLWVKTWDSWVPGVDIYADTGCNVCDMTQLLNTNSKGIWMGMWMCYMNCYEIHLKQQLEWWQKKWMWRWQVFFNHVKFVLWEKLR